jgi:hypothetical protein
VKATCGREFETSRRKQRGENGWAESKAWNNRVGMGRSRRSSCHELDACHGNNEWIATKEVSRSARHVCRRKHETASAYASCMRWS